MSGNNEKVIALDVEGRKLIIKKRIYSVRDRPIWEFFIDEAKHRRTKDPPVEFHVGFADVEIIDLAHLTNSVRFHLYRFVSSSWLDENWKTLETEIRSALAQLG